MSCRKNNSLCLQTAGFCLLLPSGAVDFWRGRQDAFDLILVTEDGRVLVTAGIAEAFTADEKAGNTYEIIS